MSRLIDLLRRLLGAGPEARTTARLVRERPAPEPHFVDGLRRQLGPRWALLARPSALWLRVVGLGFAGFVLLAVAAVIAGNG